jgi:hypothetical protein
MPIRLRRTTAKLTVFAILISAICSACITSVRTGNKEADQAKADRLVIRFHELYNESRFEEIYGLLDDSVRQSVNKEAFLSGLQQTSAKWGKVRDSKLSEGKVFIGSPVQVRAIYNVTYEKGQGQEWFITIIRGDNARLAQYTNAEGSDRPKPN